MLPYNANRNIILQSKISYFLKLRVSDEMHSYLYFLAVREPCAVEKCEKVVPKIDGSSEDVRRRKQVLTFIKTFSPEKLLHYDKYIYEATGMCYRSFKHELNNDQLLFINLAL